MFFKVFSVFFLILICTSIAHYCRSTKYAIAIRGTLKCPLYRRGYALIMISDNMSFKENRKPIVKHYAKYNRPFYLSKRFKYSKRQPQFYIKIFHSCTTFASGSFERMFLRKIPKYYIKSGTKKHTYNLRNLELSTNGVKSISRVGTKYNLRE